LRTDALHQKVREKFRPSKLKLTTPKPQKPAMLTEQFVAAISASTKANTGITKDAGIFVHEFQPLAAQRHVFKRSATAPNGIAVSSSHIFAAQADKAIVHVYSREKGNQEAMVPFPERIHSIALAAQETVLLLGTESGRVLAWEVSEVPAVNLIPEHRSLMPCRYAQAALSPHPHRISSQ
jgi:pre-rRNA-processing protein IPI3